MLQRTPVAMPAGYGVHGRVPGWSGTGTGWWGGGCTGSGIRYFALIFKHSRCPGSGPSLCRSSVAGWDLLGAGSAATDCSYVVYDEIGHIVEKWAFRQEMNKKT